MKKLLQIREHVLKARIGVKAKNLMTFAEKGKVQSWHRGEGQNDSFKLVYTAHLIIMNYAKDPNMVLFVVRNWLENHQSARDPEEILNFHVDIIDHCKVDLSIVIELDERIDANDVEGGTSIAPVPDANVDDIDLTTLFPGLNDA